ncbi:MAG: DUF1045 domain-containing protein [Devosia nanyangense]|uniref:DUF1045 domain-containing protein n=1 Tax=Devosia nanyangense TaxID=1228055 RepID=A0A933KYA1_9HYPH|nr:DUF1045 domain-containing protein [Devosia nanyangense]
MTERFAIYFAPQRDSALATRAEAWLAQPQLQALTGSARKYGFHATLKAPMALKAGTDQHQLAAALAAFARNHAPVAMGRLEAGLIDGFLALTPVAQPQELIDFAAEVTTAFDDFRAPPGAEERARRLMAPLTDRQIELLDRYGYPYVFEQFQLHMTLTDRLPPERRDELVSAARDWFAAELALPIRLDRLVLFHEPEPGAAFCRLDDYVLER